MPVVNEYRDITKGIHQAVKDRLEDKYGYRIEYPNHVLDKEVDKAWVKVSIISGNSERRELGDVTDNRPMRNIGILQFDVFTPGGEGTAETALIVQTIIDEFKPSVINNVRFDGVSPSVVTGRIEGTYWRETAQSSFYSDYFI